MRMQIIITKLTKSEWLPNLAYIELQVHTNYIEVITYES